MDVAQYVEVRGQSDGTTSYASNVLSYVYGAIVASVLRSSFVAYLFVYLFYLSIYLFISHKFARPIKQCHDSCLNTVSRILMSERV